MIHITIGDCTPSDTDEGQRAEERLEQRDLDLWRVQLRGVHSNLWILQQLRRRRADIQGDQRLC